MQNASATRASGLNPSFSPKSSIAGSQPRERSATHSSAAYGRTCDGCIRSLLARADKPPESLSTIPAELHRAVMQLAPEDRRDRAAVNQAAARILDPKR